MLTAGLAINVACGFFRAGRTRGMRWWVGRRRREAAVLLGWPGFATAMMGAGVIGLFPEHTLGAAVVGTTALAAIAASLYGFLFGYPRWFAPSYLRPVIDERAEVKRWHKEVRRAERRHEAPPPPPASVVVEEQRPTYRPQPIPIPVPSSVGEPERLVAYTSRRQSVIMIVLSLVMTGASVLCLTAGPRGGLVGLLGLIFFGGATFWFATRMAEHRPSLILDANGLLDQASLGGVGLVPWYEVVELKYQMLQGSTVLSVFVRNPNLLLARQSPLKRRLNATSARMLGTPVNIPLAAVDVPRDELVAAIQAWQVSR